MTAKRYRAIEHNYDLLRWAVEDTHTQRHCGDEGEGDIVCHCFASDEAKVIATALNAADALATERAAHAETTASRNEWRRLAESARTLRTLVSEAYDRLDTEDWAEWRARVDRLKV